MNTSVRKNLFHQPKNVIDIVLMDDLYLTVRSWIKPSGRNKVMKSRSRLSIYFHCTSYDIQ